MTIAFFKHLNSNLSSKLNHCNNFNEVIDVCVENVFEFHTVIKLVHGSHLYNTENCQVKSFYEILENTLLGALRESIAC